MTEREQIAALVSVLNKLVKAYHGATSGNENMERLAKLTINDAIEEYTALLRKVSRGL